MNIRRIYNLSKLSRKKQFISTRLRNRMNSETIMACIAPEFTAVVGGVCVSQSFVFCVVFCRSLIFLLPVGHCVGCPSSIYGV